MTVKDRSKKVFFNLSHNAEKFHILYQTRHNKKNEKAGDIMSCGLFNGLGDCLCGESTSIPNIWILLIVLFLLCGCGDNNSSNKCGCGC